LIAAQSVSRVSPDPGSQEEALRLISIGQFVAARQVVEDLVEDAERAGSPPGYKAGLFHLLGVVQNRLGRYEEASTALNRGLQASDHIQQTVPELILALLVELGDANLNQGHADEAYRGLVRAWRIA
jgi:hypothetical protein